PLRGSTESRALVVGIVKAHPFRRRWAIRMPLSIRWRRRLRKLPDEFACTCCDCSLHNFFSAHISVKMELVKKGFDNSLRDLAH
ncbi:MAG TPA: hypothetical protein PLY10_11425, partial [Bacillota bacterium]|nr:hypothetical protein [Bacillota bacterium]HPZ55655.1 hypothetical protein [Bacillota bacterium]